jgi:hypothetical protein
MELNRGERLRYFAPTAICGYLSLLCLALIATSAFLSKMQDAIALTAAGTFGLLMAGGLGLLFWRAQRRDLEYRLVATARTASQNFDLVRALFASDGWTVLTEVAGERLEGTTTGTPFAEGERVAVRFEGSHVLVASVCDPGVGYSMVGRRRCDEHRERIRASLASAFRG